MSRRGIQVTVDIQGVVQGVGFRPTVKRLADRASLAGWVQNRSQSVRLVIEGRAREVEQFLAELPTKLPSVARIDETRRLEQRTVEVGEGARFLIRESVATGGHSELLPPDLAGCSACLAEVMDPQERRYGYPFTTCTDCGPRYTVAFGPPFDRERTTLAAFPLCAPCREEYENPEDRRFHAQTIACADCGPKLRLVNEQGETHSGAPLTAARAALASGAILAVRGIGGYLLVVDGFNPEAIARLRSRKGRPDKPLAVMVPDKATVQEFCEVNSEESALLEDRSAPIVICRIREKCFGDGVLPLDGLSPDTRNLGVMLPTSPLHLLLALPLIGDPTPRFQVLVMTSGNVGGEPICTSDREARERLRGVADLWLHHDREIHRRCDDSLVSVQRGRRVLLRRARGFAPQTVELAVPQKRRVLAMGAEIKNTVALTLENAVLLSPHIGDLGNVAAVEAMEAAVDDLLSIAETKPDVVAVDLHPDMHSTMAGRALASAWGVECMAVQHHHAHAAAVLAEHRRSSGLALVFDGTGLGEDGSFWGAEVLAVDGAKFSRLATFAPAPLPGGDAAIREPRRQLVARWQSAGMDPTPAMLARLQLDANLASIWKQQCRQALNTPLSHSAGRLFDSVAAALGFAPLRCTYEGQAAIRLEEAARRCVGDSSLCDLPYRIIPESQGAPLQIDWAQVFEVFAGVIWDAAERERYAFAFHHAVARAACDMLRHGVEISGERSVALGGGVFVNRLLMDILCPMLRREGFEVLCARNLPPNDGAIAFGQAVVAGVASCA